MKTKPWLWMLLPLTVFIVLIVFLAGGLSRDPKLLPSAKLNKPFPDFTLSTLAQPQSTLTQQALLGKPYFLNVWATWCPSCFTEHGMLINMQQAGARIVGLNYKDDLEKARVYLKRYKDPFVVSLFDPEGDLGFDLGVTGAPETFLIDADGKIVHKVTGVITRELWQDDLQARYQALVEKLPSTQQNSEPET